MGQTSRFKAKQNWKIGVSVLALALVLIFAPVARAQLPFLPEISWSTFKFNQNPNNNLVSACVRLDGRCIFKILDRQSDLTQRIKYTEDRLREIALVYFAADNSVLKIDREAQNGLENIYIAVGERRSPVLTLYPKDASVRGINLEHQAEQIIDSLERGLTQAKQERSRSHLIQQAKLAGAALLALLVGQFMLCNGLKCAYRVRTAGQKERVDWRQSLTDYVTHKPSFNLRAIQYRLLQVLQILWWLGGTLLLLGLFPQTRGLQIWLIALIRIPLRIGIAGLASYIAIRLSNIAIAKLNSTLAENYVMSRDVRRRTQLRINTITRLLGGIVAVFWIVLGILVALSAIGVNLTPLLAGAGILGLAFSFASQNIIKDALNGFLIILEDQYAVGDVVNVGEFSGMVENLNLRITQLRDGQGRLITIPNSEIRTVANLSSQWSRAEIDIPIAYQVEIDRAIELITMVAQEMDGESEWQEQIIEPPEVLGVNEFSDRGSVVRIWIKTEPLKQWLVAREFRRRLQIVFDRHNIPLPLTQHQIRVDN